MSSNANWSYTAKATIWRAIGEDNYGKKQFNKPEVIMCNYGFDASFSSGEIGLGFIVKNTFWTEYSQAKQGDFILIGESSITDPIEAGANEIRHIIQYADTFERKADDFALITGV